MGGHVLLLAASLNGGNVLRSFGEAAAQWARAIVPGASVDWREALAALERDAAASAAARVATAGATGDADGTHGTAGAGASNSTLIVTPTLFGERHAPAVVGAITGLGEPRPMRSAALTPLTLAAPQGTRCRARGRCMRRCARDWSATCWQCCRRRLCGPRVRALRAIAGAAARLTAAAGARRLALTGGAAERSAVLRECVRRAVPLPVTLVAAGDAALGAALLAKQARA